MERVEVAVVGSGPAGLSAAIEAKKFGADVVLIDENNKPGGQLFKQIHKFFGSREHGAGKRGFQIGLELMNRTRDLGVDVRLDTVVYGLFNDKRLGLFDERKSETVRAEKMIFSTGAYERPLAFPGWTLFGVVGAGAMQTMINVWRVLPGKRVLMIGSGNVGLVVSYQLLQAGADVVAVIETAPTLGGYGVHAAKIRRAGVPILTSHAIKEARGEKRVKEATIVKLDEKGRPIPDAERHLEVDTICTAVGLQPRIDLPSLAGCAFEHSSRLGGFVPIHDENMETTVPGIYVAGDSAGIGEANSAMEEGKLAGTAAVESLGILDGEAAEETKERIRRSILSLRVGPFGRPILEAKKRIVEAKRGLIRGKVRKP